MKKKNKGEKGRRELGEEAPGAQSEWENGDMILNLNNLLISLHIHIFHAWWPPATFVAITHRGNDIKANAGGDYGTGAICSYLAESPLSLLRATVTDECVLAKTTCLSQLKIPTTSLGPNGAKLRWGGEEKLRWWRQGGTEVPFRCASHWAAKALPSPFDMTLFFFLKKAKRGQLQLCLRVFSKAKWKMDRFWI